MGLPEPSASRLTKSDRNIGGAISQAHAFVLAFRRIGQLHAELVPLAIQGLRAESQLVAAMKLLQDFFQAACVCLTRYLQVLAPSLGRNVVRNGFLFS